MTTPDLALDEEAKRVAAASRGLPPAAVIGTDLGPRFPSFRSTRLFVFAEADRRRPPVVVFTTRDGPAVATGTAGLVVLGKALADDGLALPAGLPAEELADVVRLSMKGTGAIVASPRLLRPDARLRSWLARGGEEAELRSLCTGPVLTTHGGTWTLRFHVIDRTGAVEAWKAAGTAASIEYAGGALSRPAGTFTWPYAL